MSAARPLPVPGLPAWVRHADGRLTPFDADAVCQRLFAAAESLGCPNAFLARELTDGVLYFLAQDAPGKVIAADALDDTVVKVVRALRHPALARAYVGLDVPAAHAPEIHLRFSPRDPPQQVFQTCLSEYSLQAIFSRDLAAAHRDGLLTLMGLGSPLGLFARVADETCGPEESVRALDAPEFGARADGVALPPGRWLVNANAAPPPRVAQLADGPLFGPGMPQSDDEAAQLDGLAEHFAHAAGGAAMLHWHVGERDFREAPRRRRLLRLVRAALDGGPVAFVFDRPRRPVALGAGLERGRPAVLMAVALHLPRLLELPGVAADPEVYLAKLGSLARLALSAGVQKRAFLRRHAAELSTGFYLERARLVVAPVGLDAVVGTYIAGGLCGGEAGLMLGVRLVTRLKEVLAADGRGALLDACLETPEEFGVNGPPEGATGVVGLTPWCTSAAPEAQLAAAGTLHAAAGLGTAALLFPGAAPAPEAFVELLRHARRVGVVRVCVAHASPHRQATWLGE